MSTTRTEENDTQSSGIVARILATASLVWKLKQYIPTAASTAYSYYTSAPEAWDLRTALIVALAKQAAASSIAERKVDPNDEAAIIREAQEYRKRIEGLIAPKTLPKNGAIWETSFKVEKRGLGGVLKESDNLEDGNRVIEAEWSCHDTVLTKKSLESKDRVLLYFHGGAYTRMSPRTHRALCLELSKELNCPVFSVDYRLSPETKFPGHLHDAVAAYYHLTSTLKIPASNILVSGDSAGGNLTTALLLYLRDNDLPLPVGGILFSPWVDLTASFATWDSNAHSDYLTMDPSDPLNPPSLFVRSEQDLVNLYVSPAIAKGSLGVLPPLLVMAGGCETLRDEITLFVRRLVQDGTEVNYEIFEGGVHVFVALMAAGIGKRGIQNVGRWSRDLFERVSKEETKIENENWKEVGEALKRAWDEKEGSLTVNERRKIAEEEEQQDRFIYEEVIQEPPEIELRQTAHSIAIEAFEENLRHTVKKGLTTLVKARRNPIFK